MRIFKVTKKWGAKSAEYFGLQFECSYETDKHVGFVVKRYTKTGEYNSIVYVPKKCVTEVK